MASPFHAFRKHQRQVLAVVGVVCIFTFTVGPVILEWFQPDVQSGSANAEAVVTWKGGELTEAEMGSLRAGHQLTVMYLDQVVAEAIKRGGSPKGAGVDRAQNGQIISPGISRDDSEMRIVRTILLAEQAEKLGMEVPDDVIYDFLAQVSDRTLSSDDLRNLLGGATRNRLTRDQLFAVLRRELLASNYVRLIAAGDVMTPEDAWNYYNRLTRRVNATFVEFRAEDYLSKAPEPKPQQVQEYYDKYKDQFPFPSSPEPGFKKRAKFDFAYFKADYDKFIEEEKAKIAPEAVQKYYDEHKENYKTPELPAVKTKAEDGADAIEPPAGAPGETPTPPAGATPPVGTPNATEPSAATPGETPAPPTEEPTTESPAPDVSEPKAEGDAAPATEPPSQCTQDATETQPAAEPAAPSDPAPEATPATPAEPPADPATPAEPATTPETPAAEAPQTPAKEGAPAATPLASETPAAEKSKGPTYQPLSEVEDDIRRTLASAAASARIEKAFSETERLVSKYSRSFASYLAQEKRGSKASKPAPPKYDEIAARLGLQYGTTPLVDELTVGETELGKASTFTFTTSFQQVSFAQVAMGNEQAPLYKPNQIGAGQDQFLFWATKIEPSRVPALDEVRDEVVRAWRLNQAFDLALNAARKAVESLRKTPADKPIREVVGAKNATIVHPPAFSWMTTGAMAMGGGAPFLNEIEGVENAGPALMEEVFSLQTGDIGVAPNESKTAAYAIRVEGETPGEDIRRDMFVQAGIQFNFNLQYVAQYEMQTRLQGWLKEMETEWKLDWKRPPRSANMG